MFRLLLLFICFLVDNARSLYAAHIKESSDEKECTAICLFTAIRAIINTQMIKKSTMLFTYFITNESRILFSIDSF